MDIERMTDEQISEYIKLRQQENPSDYSYQPKGPSEPGVMGTALVELDKNGNPRKSKQYLNSITPKLGASKGTTEIDAEIERLQALKAQNNKPQTTENNKPADGMYNPADYIGQITNKMNEASYVDGPLGEKKSHGYGDKFSKNLEVTKNAGRRTGFEKDTDGTPLPETAYEWITQQLNAARARGPVSEYTLKAIENGAKVRYNVPSDFDISGKGWFGNTDKAMAKAMNSMPYNGKSTQTPQKPAQPEQKPAQEPTKAQSTQTQQTQKPVQDISPKTKLDDERTAAYKKIKAKQASDADLALFKNYTEEQLKKVGFGPISIAAIKGTASKTSQQPTNTSVGDLTDEDKQFMKQYHQAAGSRNPKDRKFLTPENVKRYGDLSSKQTAYKKANKNANKIKYLKGQLEAHKNIMAAYPDRQDIQKAQQWYVDDLTKKIQALGGSVD